MSSPLKLQNYIPLPTHARTPNESSKNYASEFIMAQGDNQDITQDQNMDTSQVFESVVKQVATPKANISDILNPSAQMVIKDANGQKKLNDNIIETKIVWQNIQELKSSYDVLKNQSDLAAKMTDEKDALVIPQQKASLDVRGQLNENKDITEIKNFIQKDKNLSSLNNTAQSQAIVRSMTLDDSKISLSSNQVIVMDAKTLKNSFSEEQLDKNILEKIQAFLNLENQKPIALDANSITPCLNDDLKIVFQPLEKLEPGGKDIEMLGNKILVKQKIPTSQKQINHQSHAQQSDCLFFAKSSSFNAKPVINFQFQIPYEKSDNQNTSSNNSRDNQESKTSQPSTLVPKQKNSFSFALSSPNLGEVMVRIKKISNDFKLTFLCSKNSTAITLGKNISILDSQLSSRGIAVSSFGIVGVESDCMRQVGLYSAAMNLMMSKKYIKSK